MCESISNSVDRITRITTNNVRQKPQQLVNHIGTRTHVNCLETATYGLFSHQARKKGPVLQLLHN